MSLCLSLWGLQNQLNNLKAEADTLKLEVNLAKTSIIVFRKGGDLSRHERWTYGNVELEVVNSYKYLGIALTTKLSTTQAVADFIPKAKRKIITIWKALRKINCTDWGVFSKTFDAQIQPALLYASDIWGTGRVETVEKVHLFAIKRFLRLSNRTPSIIVYGESGRYPLAVSSQIRSIKYWLRLLKLNQDRLPFGAYRCSQNLAERGKVSWAGRVKELLLKQGFGEVWYNQGVADEKKFLRTFSQRLKECFGQSWHDKLELSNRFFEYKLMKQNFGMEEYICSMKGHLRDALLRFRAGVSWIKAHIFCFKPGADTSCPFCPHETEDGLHVLCKCTTYNNIRPDFLRRDGLRSSVPYHSVMETTNQCRLQQIALFLIKAGKMRQITD